MPTAGKILITGVTSIVGSAVALEIARAGFKLRGTSRSKQRASEWSAKYPHVDIEWMTIGDHSQPGAYDDAVSGCEGVCHVAGPYTLTHKSGEEIMVPQVEGMRNILEACAKAESVKRLVYTSTQAAINDDPHLGTSVGRTFTEEDWNPSTWEKGVTGEHDPVTSYCCGKTCAERLAWKFMDERKPHFDLVALCPGTVYGAQMQVVHSLNDLDAASARLWRHITNANDEIPGDPSPYFSNVHDVAESHLKALTWPKCGGERYMITSGSYSYARIFAILKKAFPEQASRFPDIENDGLPLRPSFVNINAKAQTELGMRWRSIEETAVEAATLLFDLERREAQATNGSK